MTIQLSSLDTSTNRNRFYQISINDAAVQCVWCRQGRNKRTLIKEFENEAEKIKFVNELLKRRKRNGYLVVNVSPDFPSLALLADFATTTPPNQLTLF